MRGLLPALASQPDGPADGFVVFDRAAHDFHGLPRVHFRRLPSIPAPLFSGLAIQAVLPRSVTAVLYQSFTPPVSRASRVVVIHDLIYLTHPELFTRAELAYLRILPPLLARAEVIAAVSSEVRSEILDRFPGRPPETVTVIPNGVDRRFFLSDEEADLAARRTRLEFGLDRPYLVAVGRRNPRKNLARLVQAFVQNGLPDLQLVLAGPSDGPSDRALDEELSRLAPGRVLELGEVPDSALPGLYAGALAACYVSLAEGFGVPPLEAMATGTPVIASSIPVIREVTGSAALLVDPLRADEIADAMRRVVTDQPLRETLTDSGRLRAGLFRWERSAGAAIRALEAAARLRV